MQNEPELKIDEDGNKYWYLNGLLHREDGPAIEYTDGTKRWFLYNCRHREDGPAIEFSNGNKSWYLNNNKYSFEEWLQQTPLSSQEKVKLRLQYED